MRTASSCVAGRPAGDNDGMRTLAVTILAISGCIAEPVEPQAALDGPAVAPADSSSSDPDGPRLRPDARRVDLGVLGGPADARAESGDRLQESAPDSAMVPDARGKDADAAVAADTGPTSAPDASRELARDAEPDAPLPSAQFCYPDCEGPALVDIVDAENCPLNPIQWISCPIPSADCGLSPDPDDPISPVLGSIESGMLAIVRCAVGDPVEVSPGEFACLDAETGMISQAMLGEFCRFDAGGRLTLETGDWGARYSYGYDAAGRPNSYLGSGEGEGGDDEESVHCSYDDDGRLVASTRVHARDPLGDWSFRDHRMCARYDASGHLIRMAIVDWEGSQDLFEEMWAARCTTVSPDGLCLPEQTCEFTEGGPLISVCNGPWQYGPRPGPPQP